MEFQAVVLAGGRGTRMEELTSGTPKCLLPIGSKPMIWYPVRMLEKAGFAEINIITFNSIKALVESELRNTHGIRAHLNMYGIEDNNEEDEDELGTANSLSLLKDKLVHDCVFVSCDLISNFNIQSILNFFRVKNASVVTALANSVEQSLELPVPGDKGKYSPERDIVGLDPATSRLLYFGAEADIEEIKLKDHALKKFPKIIWTNKLHDAHLYVVKKWLIDYVLDNKRIFSLKSDLVPFVCKKQFSLRRKQIKEINQFNAGGQSQSGGSKHKLFDYIKQDETNYLINRLALNNFNHDLISVYAYIQDDGFCYRANNAAIYAEANRQVVHKIMPAYVKEASNESTSKFDKAQVSADSVVSEDCVFGEKAIVKKSVIGRNCKIGEKAKIANSILMDNVVVAEGVLIQGSIVCSNCKLNSKSEFKDCIIGYNQNIISTGKYNNETIQDVDSFIDDEEDI